MELGKFS